MSYYHARLAQGTGGSKVNYIPITTSPYTILSGMLKPGVNVFGINVAGAASIYIPSRIRSIYLLAFKDESGAASSNPITLIPT